MLAKNAIFIHYCQQYELLHIQKALLFTARIHALKEGLWTFDATLCSAIKEAMKKHIWKKPESLRLTLEKYLSRIGKPEQVLLTRLWQHWSMVMGPEISSLAWPLGSKNNILLLGGEDAMSIQEISYMHHEILERANAFMGKEYFSTVKVRLSLDKTPLNEAATPKKTKRVQLSSPVVLSGKYLKDMPADSPVARCYARYVQKSRKEQNLG